VADVEAAAEYTPPPADAAPGGTGRALDDDIVRPVAMLLMARVKQSSLVDFLS
jgi:hypothetical protein